MRWILKKTFTIVLIILSVSCNTLLAYAEPQGPIFSNYDIKEVEVISSSDYSPLDLNGPANSGVSDDYSGSTISQIPSSTTTDSTVYNYERLVMVGDSRTVGIANALGANQIAEDVYNTGYEYFICKTSMGYDWLSSTAINLINSYATPKTALVFWLGINDYGYSSQYNRYADLISHNAGGWGCDLYYADITCLARGDSDAIKAFNTGLKSRLGSGVHWIDLWDFVENGITSGNLSYTDGIHYTSDTYSAIYQRIKQAVGSIGVNATITTSNSYSSSLVNDTILFFTKFESGDDAYAQTGGDGGNACGKYQFDYRYSLASMIQYAYSQNPSLCQEFAAFQGYSDGDGALQGNQSLYAAWKTIYNRNPSEFAKLQDEFAFTRYYMPVQNACPFLASRSDVIKGAAFSYAIQHGSETAITDIIRINGASLSDADFINAIYNYRASKFGTYASRYESEKALALSLL